MNLDKNTRKSIELGFNGKINDEMFEKWKFTNTVRYRLLAELSIALLMFIGGIYSTIYNHVSFIVVVFLSGLVIFKNVRIWQDIYKIRKERFEKYEKNKITKI